MRVRMLAQISGTRNGKPWPGKGAALDLPDAEAVQLCAAGLAETVKGAPEKAVPAKAEVSAVPEPEDPVAPAPEKRGPGRPRKTPAK
jgi:hypothetical protein